MSILAFDDRNLFFKSSKEVDFIVSFVMKFQNATINLIYLVIPQWQRMKDENYCSDCC